MAAIEAVAHLLFLAVFAATVYHNIANIFIDGVTNSYGRRFKFLTFINLLLSVMYYGLAFFNDVAMYLGRAFKSRNKEVKENSRTLTKLRDLIFGALVFPLSFIVTFAFWGVMAVDSELMLASNLRHMIPVHGWYNHSAHTCPLILSLMEMFIVNHPYFPSRKRGSLLFTAFCVGYLSWIMWIAHAANIWVYPVLKVLGWSGRSFFLGGAYLFGLSCFILGCFIDSKKRRVTVMKFE